MNKLQIIILLLLTCNLSAKVSFKAYTSNDGLAHNTVFSIGQDGDGFMWFGTANGVTRFDGKKFISFLPNNSNNNAIPGIEVRQIICDKNGDVWVYSDGKIARYNKHKQNFENFGYNQNGRAHIKGQVRQLYSDPNGKLWVCTSSGVFQFDFKKEKFKPLNLYQKQLQVSNLRQLTCDFEGRYWVATNNGIYVFNSFKEKQDITFIEANKENKLFVGGFTCFAEGLDGNMYLSGTIKGLYSIHKKTFKVIHFDGSTPSFRLSSNRIHSIAFDAKERLWIGTELGVNIYNTKTKNIIVHKQNFNRENSINDNAIYPIYRDKHNNMWVGTYFGGVNVSLSRGNSFKHYKAGVEPHFLGGKAVSQIVEDHKGNLWIGTEDGGISYFDLESENFIHYSDNKKQTVSYINVHSLYLDKKKQLWIGTYLGGLNIFDGKKFTYFRKNNNATNWLISDHVFALNADEKDNIWVGTTSGLCLYDKSNNQFVRAKGDVGRTHVYDILKSKDGSLWIGTYGGGIFIKKNGTNQFVSIEELVKDSNVSLPTHVTYLCEASDGLIWMGTLNQGLYSFNQSNGEINRFTTENALPDNMVYAIVEDLEQILWITTNKGLVRYDPVRNRFRLFTTEDGLPNNQFNYKGGLRHSNGKIYFGSVNGMIEIEPEKIKKNNYVPEIKITGISLFGKDIHANDDSQILLSAAVDTRKIELKHNQSVIGFEFTAVDYTSPETNQFAYRMEGLEEEWNYPGNFNKASYAHLPPGKYKFTVKGCNNNGLWNEEGTSIDIIVKPPFWLSIWGYLFYALVLFLLLLAYRKYSRMRAEEKSKLERERLQKEKIEEVNQLKLKFYTNISHEFRTPLSLIVDPLENILENDIRNPKLKSTVNMVLRNAQRLQILVNHLLDFRKSESGQFKLKVSKDSIESFTRSIFSRFIPLAEKKNIDFVFEEVNLPESVYFDKKVVETILYNLLSNAFKHTIEGGRILLKLEYKQEETKAVDIWVNDNGRGIPKELQEKIFDRFYQADNNDQSGSGIGLSLTKSLTELHHGQISVKSEENEGTSFCVRLAVDRNVFTEDEIGAQNLDPNLPVCEDEITRETTEEEQLITESNIKVLIVEDNDELRDHIRGTLQKTYKVITAENGRKGWYLALEKLPDIIISDVMMPEMDGFELCKKIKSDIKTSHIPIVLLTAKSGVQNQSEGLDLGADVYLEKPFSSRVLLAQINNLLRLKERFIKRFESELGIDVAEVTHSSKDEEFIKKAIQVIFDHLDDSDFNVTALIEKMAVSRSLLHMKLKEITGKSASEFIQSIKLKEAARLLKNDKLSISEVSYKTGFKEPSYFSKCFKKQFGQSPTAYQRMNIE